MRFRVAWLRIKPMSTGMFQKLADGIAADQFTKKVTSGFIIDVSRKSSIQARFIQKQTFQETFTDPFGNTSSVERTDYTQTRFTLATTAPHIEVVNSTRNLNPLISRFGEFSEGKVAIYLPKKSVAELMEKAAEKAKSAKITGLLISDVQFSSTAIGKILVKGSEDVKGLLPQLVGKKKHTINEAQMEITTPDCSFRITIKENCRFTVQTNQEADARNFLRQLVGNLSE